jgi:hypothetical protein
MMLASTAKDLASHDPFLHAARHHSLEQLAQKIALAEPAVAVLGKGRMIGNVTVEPQSTGSPALRSERAGAPTFGLDRKPSVSTGNR